MLTLFLYYYKLLIEKLYIYLQKYVGSQTENHLIHTLLILPTELFTHVSYLNTYTRVKEFSKTKNFRHGVYLDTLLTIILTSDLHYYLLMLIRNYFKNLIENQSNPVTFWWTRPTKYVRFLYPLTYLSKASSNSLNHLSMTKRRNQGEIKELV